MVINNAVSIDSRKVLLYRSTYNYNPYNSLLCPPGRQYSIFLEFDRAVLRIGLYLPRNEA